MTIAASGTAWRWRRSTAGCGSWWWAGGTATVEQTLQKSATAWRFATGCWRRTANGSWSVVGCHRGTANRCRSRSTAHRGWRAARRGWSTAWSGSSAKQTRFSRLGNSGNSHGQNGQQTKDTFHLNFSEKRCFKVRRCNNMSLHSPLSEQYSRQSFAVQTASEAIVQGGDSECSVLPIHEICCGKATFRFFNTAFQPEHPHRILRCERLPADAYRSMVTATMIGAVGSSPLISSIFAIVSVR